MSDEITTCRCSGGCSNRRCRCFRDGQACGAGCACADCANPFDRLAGVTLGECARVHVVHIAGLSADARREQVELPCGCGTAPLEALLASHDCPGCGTSFWYSFCWNDVVQEGNTWHCATCRVCRDWREWHCERCNRCTYGQSFPCERCGALSELGDLFDGDATW